ncbi:hypothetical protein HMPREF1221_01348 [Treponema socranskii subsp. paredis ATCC 35535]|nr:hypothetical protein HMPREF1221_01348 [Treponema socranskii subsp. paredis ATCC 35535]
MSASNKRKTLLAFFDFRLKRINPSSAELATSAEREVPRATCNERGARSSPRRIYERIG